MNSHKLAPTTATRGCKRGGTHPCVPATAASCRQSLNRWIFTAVALLLLPLTAATQTVQSFATPDQAAAALAAAVNARDLAGLRAIFGPSFDDITSPDPAQAELEMSQFTAAFNQAHRVVNESPDRSVLEVGNNHWPFAVPLAKKANRWVFDTDAGREEVINRRVGRNEITALRAARAYVEAQREYAGRDRDGDGVLEYAQKLISSLGRKDGLYWSPDLDGEISPIGPLIASAQSQGYVKNPNADADPFFGYYFRILPAQGKDAPGGKYDFITNGNMIGGFALVAYPSAYGETGIMTFIVNQQGRVYEKDLGPDTGKLAREMTAYNPDKTWRVSRD